MGLIRSTTTNRLLFAALVAGLIVLTVIVLRTETDQEWRSFQKTYHARHQEMLKEKHDAALRQGEKKDAEKWARLYQTAREENQLARKQVFLPAADVRDLCQTCHLGIENDLFQGAPQPFRTHPSAVLESHPPQRFGCTLCHQGQGVAVTAVKAHGNEPNWPTPRVPINYTQGLCLRCHETPYGLQGAEKAESGRRLFLEYGCHGCHQASGLDDLPSFSTPLDQAGQKIVSREWLFGWLQNPPNVRPGTRMPVFRLAPAEIAHLTAYLENRRSADLKLMPVDITTASADRGKQTFTEKGCIACHSATRDEGGLTDRVPNLADAGKKLAGNWIRTWLARPADIDPATPMPTVTLDDREQLDIIAYLLTLKSGPDPGEPKTTPVDTNRIEGDAEQGLRLVQSLGCYGCHPIKTMSTLPRVGVEVSAVARKRLEELPFGNADIPRTKWDWLYHKIKQPEIYKTDDTPLKMPAFDRSRAFSELQVEALTVFYLHQDRSGIPEAFLHERSAENRTSEKGSRVLDQYNCRGCHQFAETETARIERYLALKTMAPPRLLGEGERVQPQWLFQYLSRPNTMRPWLQLRMPEFNWSYAEKQDLISYFAMTTGKPAPVSVPYVMLPVREDYDDEIIAMGEYRMVTDKCMQCHPAQQNAVLPKDVKIEDLSINLMLSKNRLRYEWIKDFLRNPDRYAGRGTKMPFVFYTPDGVPRIPDPEMWIDYTTLYLMFMKKEPAVPKKTVIEDVRPGSEVDWTSY